MRPGIIDTYLHALQKQAFHKAASLVYTPGYSFWDIINKPTPKAPAAPSPSSPTPAPAPAAPPAPTPAPIPAPAPAPVAQPQVSSAPPAPVAAQRRIMPQSNVTPPAPNVDIAIPNYNVGTALNLPEALDLGGDLPTPLPDNSLGVPADTFENIPPAPKRTMPKIKATPPTPNVDVAVPDYNVGVGLNLPETLDLGEDLPAPLPANSLGVPVNTFKNTALDTPEVHQALAEQERIRKQYAANARKVKRKRRTARNETQRIIDAEKARRAAGVARTNIMADTGRYIRQQEAAGNALPAPKVKPAPQAGSNAYSNPEAAYNMFVRRGVSPTHARAASDAIRTYNAQRNKGADHKTAMDIVNTSFAPGMPLEYQEQMIDHLNRQYRMNQNSQYINPNYTREQAMADARWQAARDNNRFLNPSNFTNKDRLRGAFTYVGHGGQVVDPRTGQVDRRATARRQQALNRRRADESARRAGLRWSPTRGTYVYS